MQQNGEMSETRSLSVILGEDRLRVSAVAWILSLVNSRKEKYVGQRKQKKADQVSTPPVQEHTHANIQTEGIQGESD